MAWRIWFVPLLICLNLILLPYFLWILCSTIAALLWRRKAVAAVPATPRARFLIVIPAHDEEMGIAETIRSCRAVDYPADLFEVLVIADNCSDDTAGVARREGATVVERHDSTKKSKGYALEYLIEQLKESGRFDELDALVVVDADSTVSPGMLLGFAAVVEAGEDWVQCYYGVANPEASWRTKLMAYAFSLFNGVGPLGQYVLGQSAGLRGNGMCLTTRGLRRVPWTSYGLVEDFEYSWNVRIAGGKIAFLPDVTVSGVMLEQGGKAAVIQRGRWEAGRRDVARRALAPLLRSPHLGLPAKVIAAIELTMPPLAALAAYYVALLAANVLVILLGTSPTVAAILAGCSVITTLALGLYAVAPFLALGLPWSYLLILFYFPLYAAWKLLARLHGRPAQWVRTPREEAVKH